MKPWITLATAKTREGLLELRKRGERDFLLVIDGRVLMTSVTRRSEEELARQALAAITVRTPRVLIGGLGMGFTLRAALDASPDARITVAELDPTIVDWCRTHLADLTGNAMADPRATIEIGDVAKVIGRAKGLYDAILLDLYEGPHAATQGRDDPFYGPAALARTEAALTPTGVFAVWSEDADPSFKKRLQTRFDIEWHKFGDGGRQHVVYIARKKKPEPPAKVAPAKRPERRR
ncbi:MAG: spermidine synthase [Proteobacteria bacterium]|nr:spermidine synthase [Pseudomonadota bacterium]